MPKDFARKTTRPAPKKSAQRKRRETITPTKQRLVFHAPSFSSGLVVGALVVILIAYAPEIVEQSVGPLETQESATTKQPRVKFEFPQLLSQSEIAADPNSYQVPEPKANQTFRIQAASFRNHGDAEKLRAQLLLQNLPIQVDKMTIKGQEWHRVVVGPFERRVEAQRAMTKLREQNLAAIWLGQTG
ncbi:MAG TPA: hypothetical protein DER02_10835 [Gammaproteobacteria bacterium]|nr:hypothetical protein [Gammaproteobacteria bacterium]|tara:strand:+ start:2621 stop:3181 length:561 start_codon:yes stop_codon:yes gene_type:complete